MKDLEIEINGTFAKISDSSGHLRTRGFYLEKAANLSGKGIKSILLETSGVWAGETPAPDKIQISDHVACHSLNPLTRTEMARNGEAFIDMKGAYQFDHEKPSTCVWHSESLDDLNDDLLNQAKFAGCDVISPHVMPWAVASVYQGINFSCVVRPGLK